MEIGFHGTFNPLLNSSVKLSHLTYSDSHTSDLSNLLKLQLIVDALKAFSKVTGTGFKRF